MKRALIVVTVLVVAQLVVAGGIVTNTNQSAQFVRTLSRNASTEVDAIYFNPAGLTQLENGWHFALYNQTIMQEKTVENNFPGLNQNEFVGEVNVPLFPNVYATYKKDKFAVSFGFGPNGGGGTADYADGLPSFEIPISQIPPMINGMNIPTDAYKADIEFKGSSVYYGFQLNASYALNEMFSVAVGGRYISAVNTYEGAISNIQINPTFPDLGLMGNFMSAVQFFNALAQVNPEAAAYAAMVQDVDVDVKQTGTAITPIIGLNVRPVEKLNVGIKYELNTALELTNETTIDGSGLFPDEEVARADIPAIFALGAEYAFLPTFRGQFSINYYFDKNAQWDYFVEENGERVKRNKADLVDNNYMEIGVGLEYDLTDALRVSAGFLNSTTGVSENYQTDISHSLSSSTVGLGLRYTIGGVWDVDLGTLYTMYDESTRSGSSNNVPYVETYNRSNVAIALGLGYHF